MKSPISSRKFKERFTVSIIASRLAASELFLRSVSIEVDVEGVGDVGHLLSIWLYLRSYGNLFHGRRRQ